MHCCVPFCKNTADNADDSVEGITFHSFPSEEYLHAAWLRALGKEDIPLPGSAAVCSQHFLSDDIIESKSGLRQIVPGAIPSTVLVCMMCLDTESKQVLMSKYKLDEEYEQLVGLPLCDQGKLKQTLCVVCAHRLINISRLRDKSLRARSLMKDLVEKHNLITMQHMKPMNLDKSLLKSRLMRTTLGPDHCDLHIVENHDKQTESKETLHIYETVVKSEESSEFMLMDELREVKNEYEEFVVSQEQLSVSDESIALESKPQVDALWDALRRQQSASSSASVEHMVRSTDPLKYESDTLQCAVCFGEFLHEHEFKAHMSMHHQSSDSECVTTQLQPSADLAQYSAGPLLVTVAIEEYKTTVKSEPALESDYTDNDMQHTNSAAHSLHEKMFTCDVCTKVFKEKRFLVNHIKTHNNKKIFTCDLCQYKSSRRGYLVVHMRTHTGEKPFSCSLCPYKTVRKSDLMKHFRSHSNEKPYCCKLCDYKCKINSNLVKHMRTHTREKPFSCDVCEFKCTHGNQLTAHMRTHIGEKPFSCKLCDYKCKINSNLVKHMRTHTGEKPYSCKLCEYKSANSSQLTAHMRTHTGKKPSSCKLCDYKCYVNSQLVKHMRSHTGEKPFSCKLCKYKSAHSNQLVRHMRTHTGEKPYSCKLCNYKCKINSNLVKHMRTHTGEKPYSCELCDYKSAHNKLLLIHMRTHTGEKP